MANIEARGRLPGEPVAFSDIGSNSVKSKRRYSNSQEWPKSPSSPVMTAQGVWRWSLMSYLKAALGSMSPNCEQTLPNSCQVT